MKTYKWFLLILIAGIIGACSGDSEDELVGDWQRRAFFREGGRSHTAYFVIGDKGYVCTGYNNTKIRCKELFVYDHTVGENGSWQQLSDFAGQRRQHAVGFSIGNYGYVGTGWDGDETDLRDFWRYNPGTDRWDSIAPLPATARVRRGAVSFTLNVGGKDYGYVGGGYYNNEREHNHLLDFWRFDPEGTTIGENGETLHGSWTEVHGYGGNKRAGAVAFVIENKAYICTGTSSDGPNAIGGGNVTDFWMFDPENDSWTKKRSIADVNIDEDYDDDYAFLARAYGVAFTVPAEGGQTRGHIALGGSNTTVWEYDHDQDLWTERTSFYNYRQKSPRTGAIAFSFPNTGRAYVGLGNSGVAYPDDLWEFIPMIEDYIHDDSE